MKSPQSKTPDERSGHSRRLRLAIVTRRFWPFSGSAEFAVGDLAAAIKRAGHEVDILTVRWEKNWPTKFRYLELPVHRINRPIGPWASFRYVRSLTRELTELEPDGIIIFGLGEEAWPTIKSFYGKIPIVVRVDNHLLGGKNGQPNLSSRQLLAINAATRVLVESRWSADRISSHPAVRTSSITVVPDGIQIDHQHQRTAAGDGSSRVAISDAHPILMIEPTQPLVICGSPMHGDEGLIDLVNAWPLVLNQFPKARLWVLGDGKSGRKIWERVLAKNIVNSVIMPGSFDDLRDIFQAADVYVHPLRSDETCSFLTRAMVAGCCPVVTATTATQPMIENDVNGLVVGIEDPEGLADAIILALGDNDLRTRLGPAALKSTASAYDIDNLVNHYLDPFLGSDVQVSESNTIETSKP